MFVTAINQIAAQQRRSVEWTRREEEGSTQLPVLKKLPSQVYVIILGIKHCDIHAFRVTQITYCHHTRGQKYNTTLKLQLKSKNSL